MHKIQVNSAFHWIYRLLFISFFLPSKWQTFILLGSIFIITFSAISLKVKLLKSEIFFSLLLGGGYFFYLMWIYLTPFEMRKDIYSLLERKLTYFIFPFIFLLFSKLSTISWKKEISWFVFANLLTTLMANGIILIQLLFFSQHQEVNHVYYRISFEDITHIHPTYFGMYCAFSLGILWLYGKNFFGSRSWLNYLSQCILFFSLLILMPKSALLALGLIFIYSLVYVFKLSLQHKLFLCLSLIVVTTTLYLSVPFVAQRVNEVFSFLKNENQDVINNSMNMRSLIFTTDIELLKSHWLFGIGPSALQEHINEILFANSIVKEAGVEYNAHNEYLNQWLSFGLFGFLYFLAIMVLHIYTSLRQQNQLYLFLLMILFTTFFTENVLSRQHGVVFYSLFTSLFFFMPKDSFEKVKT